MNRLVKLSAVLAICGSFVSAESKSDAAYIAIRDHLAANARFLSPAAFAEEITPEIIRKEVDAAWRNELERLRKSIAPFEKAQRDQIIASKQKVFAAWLCEYRVFVDQLSQRGAILRRYTDKKEGVSGYFITGPDAKRYYLTFGIPPEPNQSSEPTSGIVTPRAEPRAVPIPPVAHL